MSRFVDLTRAFAASVAQQGRGIMTRSAGRQPEELLELYDIENCPYCRIVREALTDLDIDVLIYPCPKNGTRFRPLAESLGGKQQFPLLFDPNTDEMLYESADIIEYLYNTYGNGRQPPRWLVKSLITGSSILASATSIRNGSIANTSLKESGEAIELYCFEASPFARLVREKLCELELPYIIRQLGRDQAADFLLPVMRDQVKANYQPTQRNRIVLHNKTGKVASPYMIDPNTGVEMYESADIVDYLETTYG